MKKISLPLILIALVLVLPNGAAAVTIFNANLTGSQENPPSGSTATGFGEFVLNDAMTALSFEVTIFGLDFTGAQSVNPSDNLVNAHIHRAAIGVNGPVVFGFFGAPFNDNNPNDVVVTPFLSDVGGTIRAKWDLLEGNNTTLGAQLGNILSDSTYINFHTVQFPAGAIRGQIVRVPEPATLLILGFGLSALAVRRRLWS